MRVVKLRFECLECGEMVECFKAGEFKECGCGKSNGDAGDGYDYRLGGAAKGLYWHGKETKKEEGQG